MLPELPSRAGSRGVALRAIAEGPVDRSDLRRHARRGRRAPLDAALVAAVRDAAAALTAPPGLRRPPARA